MVFGFQNPLRDIDAFETNICETSRGERFFLGEIAESNTDFVSDDRTLKVPTCEYKVPVVTGNFVYFLWTSFGFLHECRDSTIFCAQLNRVLRGYLDHTTHCKGYLLLWPASNITDIYTDCDCLVVSRPSTSSLSLSPRLKLNSSNTSPWTHYRWKSRRISAVS